MNVKRFQMAGWMSVLGFLLLITPGYAGTTGKIAGKVSDAKTHEPLIGANVSLVGTTLGAATDANGNYVILNVPPGKYDLRFQYIGYQPVVVKGVNVNVDFTTRIDQALQPSAIEMEEIQVVAERTPLVREDLTNTQVAITADAIRSMPVDQIREVIRLQAGITEGNDGSLHIRGGRSNEIAYQVNGVSIENPFNNLQGVGIATNAVQEVSVSSGTFSAEYGNALSGVVNYVTKEGGNRLTASLRAYSGGHVTTHDDIFFGIDNFDAFHNARIEGTLGGPFLFARDKIKFFLSGVYQKDKGYLFGIDLYDPSDILLLNESSFVLDPFGDGKPSGSGKIVPMNVRETYNFTGKLSYRLAPQVKLTYDLIYDKGRRPSGGQFRNFRFNPRGRRFLRTQGVNHSLGITHTLGKKTFYKLKLSAGITDAKNWVFDNPQDPRYQASFNSNVFNNLFPQTDYLAGGHNLNRARDNTRTYIAKLDLVSQVHPAHELRLGGEFDYFRLERETYALLHEEITGNALLIVPYAWVELN
ncbi:MAG: TonB-dependent receptor, partial [Calditrichaeota bacterium]